MATCNDLYEGVLGRGILGKGLLNGFPCDLSISSEGFILLEQGDIVALEGSGFLQLEDTNLASEKISDIDEETTADSEDYLVVSSEGTNYKITAFNFACYALNRMLINRDGNVISNQAGEILMHN